MIGGPISHLAWPLLRLARRDADIGPILRHPSAGPDYTAMTAGQLYAAVGDDGRKWAQAFAQHARKLGLPEMDLDWLTGWFANAIEVGADTKRRRFPVLGERTAADTPNFAVADARPCTCHPSEAPVPCQRQFALTDCQASARESQPGGGIASQLATTDPGVAARLGTIAEDQA